MPEVGGGGGNGDHRPRPCARRSATADRPSWHASAATANGGIGLFSRPAQQFASRQRVGSLFGGQFDQCEAGDSGDVGSLEAPLIITSTSSEIEDGYDFDRQFWGNFAI